MRKIVYPRAGGVDVIQIVDSSNPIPGPGEVCVKVNKAGLNFAELMMRQGLYGSSPKFPFTPGYEASGEIIGLGEGVDSFKEGDRVLALTGFGGWAEQVVLDESRVFLLPDEVSFEQAAAILSPMEPPIICSFFRKSCQERYGANSSCCRWGGNCSFSDMQCLWGL